MRHKNVDWNLPDGDSVRSGWRTHQWESIHAALLMDIRDELQRINARLNCHETLAIPRHLKRIVKNTAPKPGPLKRIARITDRFHEKLYRAWKRAVNAINNKKKKRGLQKRPLR